MNKTSVAMAAAVWSSAVLLEAGTLLNWHERNSGTTIQLNQVCYGANQYMAAGYYAPNNYLLRSPDGVNWSLSDAPGLIASFCSDGNVFVVVNSTQAWRSEDGVAWTPVSIPDGVFPAHVRFLNNEFLVWSNTIYDMARSADGINWTAHIVQHDYKEKVQDMAFGAGMHVGVGRYNSATPMIMRSDDNAVTWSRVDLGADFEFNHDLLAVAYGNGKFVAVGGHTGTGLIMHSSDGLTWTLQTATYPYQLSSIAFADGLFAICGGNGHILISSDGVDWTLQDTQPAIFTGIVHGQSRFLAVGKQGVVVQSAPVNPAVGPNIYANGKRGTVQLTAGVTAAITVTMNAGVYAGVPADWWMLAIPYQGASWYYYHSAAGWTPFHAGLQHTGMCVPAYQGPLMDMDESLTVLPATALPVGQYDFYFAVDAMDGVLNYPDGPILYDRVTVSVN